MKTEVISNITKDMEDSLTDYQLNKLKESLIINFEGVEFIIKTDELKHQEELDENKNMIDSFISSKQVEGCSERTIKYYKEIIEKFVNSFDKSIKQISTNEIRNYLNSEDNQYVDENGNNLSPFIAEFYVWPEQQLKSACNSFLKLEKNLLNQKNLRYTDYKIIEYSVELCKIADILKKELEL